MKQKHIIALCAVTTIAVLGAVAGTGAYLTHQTPQTVNTFAVGQLEAELTEPEWDKLPDEAKVLYPGKTVAKDPTACNAAESTTAAYMYLQVEIPRASVRTYTIAETAKADGSDETNQEPTSGAGVLDNGGEPHTVDLVSFQPNDGWSLLEETETEETHTFIASLVLLLPLGALIVGWGGTLFYTFVFRFLRARTGGYHAKTPHGCLLGSVCCQSVMLFLSAHMPDPVVSAFIAGFSCQSIALFGPANHPELHLSEKELKALQPRIYIRLLIVVALTAVLLFFRPDWGACTAFGVFAAALLLVISLQGYGLSE